MRGTADKADVAPGLAAANILVIGEALVDVVHRLDGSIDESPGGSPANVALALGRLGCRPRLLTRLGDDRRGDDVRAWLQASGVQILTGEESSTGTTSTATAFLDESGSARYDFQLDWDVQVDHAVTAGLVHTGSIAALLEPGASEVLRTVRRLHEGALVTYDPNIRPALLGDHREVRARVEEIVSLADVVKASDEDLAWLYPGEHPIDAAKAWHAIGPSIVIVTSGASGASAVTETGTTGVPAPLTAVADTVGAGDTFMSAVIEGLLLLGFQDGTARRALRRIDRENLRNLLGRAAKAAAITVSRPGADPPSSAELAADSRPRIPVEAALD